MTTIEEKEEEVDQKDLHTVPVKISVTKATFGSVYNGTLIIGGQKSLFSINFYRPLGCIGNDDIELLENSNDMELLKQIDHLFNVKFFSTENVDIDVQKTSKNTVFILSVIVDTIFQLEENNEVSIEKIRTLVREFKVEESLVPTELT